MITVYIRELNQEDGILLGEFAPEEIKPLVDLFKAYETIVDGASAVFFKACFVSDTGDDGFSVGAYFEIIVEYPTESA